MADDPLRDLRAAWHSLQPPVHGGDLEHEDAPTRRTAAWLRTAWTGLPVPPVALPWIAARRRRRARARTAAAAALLALSLGIPWWLARGTTARPSDEAPVADCREPVGTLLAAADGRLEFRSGPVHLVLLTGPTASTEPLNP